MISALSPAVVAAIDDLELAARLVVEGLRAGGHRSPLHGFSSEFQQHRPYRIGDDLKYLDWKLLARTDRLYTRQFRETTSMSVMLVLDASASMDFPGAALTKFRYACVVTAALAWLIESQGDQVGLMTMADGRLRYLPARGGRPHVRSLIAQVDRLRPAGRWEPARAIARGAELLKRRGMVLVVSDFYDDEGATRRELRRVARRGHDAAMLQVMSPDELSFPFRGDVEFEDLESGEHRRVDAAVVAREYRGGVEAFLEQVRAQALSDHVDYALLRTDVPPERSLRDYLIRRGAQQRPRHSARHVGASGGEILG